MPALVGASRFLAFLFRRRRSNVGTQHGYRPSSKLRTTDTCATPTHRQGFVAMTMRDLLLPAQFPLGQPSGSALANCVSSLGSRIAEWFATAADYYAAATVYEQLSGLQIPNCVGEAFRAPRWAGTSHKRATAQVADGGRRPYRPRKSGGTQMTRRPFEPISFCSGIADCQSAGRLRAGYSASSSAT
jgi:hypothetical protein